MPAKEEMGSNGIAQIRDLIVGEEMAMFRRQIDELFGQLKTLQKKLDKEYSDIRQSIQNLDKGHSDNMKTTEQNLVKQINSILDRLKDLEMKKMDREAFGEYLIETGRQLKNGQS